MNSWTLIAPMALLLLAQGAGPPGSRALHERAGPRSTHAPDYFDANATRRAAFNSVSAHSPSAVESHVTAPPVPKQSRPSSIQNVRMATLSSPRLWSPSTHPTVPQ